MSLIRGLVFLTILMPNAWSADLVSVPAGKIEAIWLSPVSKKGKSPTPTVIVEVAPFKAMRYAVTVGEFKAFLKVGGEQWQKDRVSRLFTDERYLDDIQSAPEKAPVTYVSWHAARAYCAAQGMRLPTVNEWEYLAAASESKPNANREPRFLQRILDWYGEPNQGQLKSVGSIYQNVYGAWDLHGLIWEWVEDFNSSFVTGESREDGSLNKNMFCGAGSMSSSDKENYAAFMRFAFRSGLTGRSAVWNLGFRCVK